MKYAAARPDPGDLIIPVGPCETPAGPVLVKPTETPELYLELPLEKKIFRIGAVISEAGVKEALGKALEEVSRDRLGQSMAVSGH